MTDIDALIAAAEEWIEIAEEGGKPIVAQTYRVLLDALTAERARVVEFQTINEGMAREGAATFRRLEQELAAERALSDRLAGALENHIGHVDWVAAEFGVHYAHRDEGFAALTAHTEARGGKE